MLPMILGGVGALASAYGNYQKSKALRKMEGPDLSAIREEFSPWMDKIKGLSSRADKLTQGGYGLRDRGYALADTGYGYLDEAEGMFDPQGAYQQTQTGLLREELGDSSNLEFQNLSSEMAKRNMGGGGINSLMQAVSQNKAMENLRKGMGDIQQSGFQRGMLMRQMGNQTINQGYNTAGVGLGHAQSGIGLYGRAMDAQQGYSENLARAIEAGRTFENQKASAIGQSQADMWGGVGRGLMSFGMGMQGMNRRGMSDMDRHERYGYTGPDKDYYSQDRGNTGFAQTDVPQGLEGMGLMDILKGLG